MGAGKTTVMDEASDLLRAADVPHAAIDLDALAIFHGAAEAREGLALRNLAAVWANYAALGISRLLIAEALVSAGQREQLRLALSASELVICRLRASLTTMRGRVRMREPGMLQEQFVARVDELEREIDAAGTADFVVDNDGRPVTDVAREVLARARWIGTP
jgi:hypothetical protein